MKRLEEQDSPEEKDQPERVGPMRNFNYDFQPDRSPRQKNRFKSKTFLLVLVVLLVVLTGIFSVFYLNSRDPVSVVKEEPAPFRSQSSFTQASDLLSAYLNALGGRQALQEVRSVRYEGRVKFPSGESDFQMMLLSPDKGMLTTNPGEFNGQKLVLNGDTAWRVVEYRDGRREVFRLEGSATESLKWSLQVHNTLRRMALTGQGGQLAFREIEYLDKPCYELTKTNSEEADFLAILDKETLYLLKMVETLRTGDEANEFTVLYEDYRMVSGVVEPYSTTLYKNGEVDNEVEVRSIQINSGVMSSLFAVPEDLPDEPQDISSRG